MHIALNAISSSEVWTSPSITVGGVTVVLDGIATKENIGSPTIRNLWVLSLESILPAEGFGIPSVVVRVLNAFAQMMEDDLEQGIFEDTEFAEHGTYTSSKTGQVFDLVIIFDHAYSVVDPDTGVALQTNEPMAQCQTSKLRRRPTSGDKIKIQGTNFEILEHDDDGTGVTTLMLHKEKTV